MITTRTRLIGATAVSLALVAGAGAAVSAQPDSDITLHGRDRDRIELRDGFGRGGRGGPGGFGETRGLLARFDRLVRQETTYQTDEGLLTRRVDNGTLVSISADTVEYSLADGQTASASIDADTEVVGFQQETVEVGRRGTLRQRMVAQQVDPTSITVGSEILVWSQSSGGDAFVAQRLVVQPEAEADDATDDAAAPADDAGTTSESPAPAAVDAAASPAPEVSPASA